ncbi:MAG TPA: hypothetical protein VLC54_01125, partial [Anaeromyxobacter sp.]|nr:hypothetical protein [Anaeromyxobacter sp.]
MPDPRSVMQEFRTLDAKRLAKGLSPEEERRFAELRDLVGGEAGGGAPRGGFDVNAAAARLRESLLPAGLRNRPPPPPELSPEPEPEPFFPAPPAPAALDDAAALAPPEAPLFSDSDADALFDPATLGWEGDPAAAEPPRDPGAPEAAAWDANAGWDPSAASAQGWDPNALPGDVAAWDPAAAPMDANGQPWDPGAQQWDPSALSGDPNAQPWDPNALDPGGQAWDPNAVAWDAGTAGGDPAAAVGWDPNALALADPGAPTPDAAWDDVLAAEVEPEPTRALALGAEAPLPIGTPREVPALDLDAGAFELEPIDDAALVADGGGLPPALAPEPTSAGWTVPALDALPDGFSFDDAAAPPEPTEMLGLATEPEPTQALPLLAADPAPLPPDGWDPLPAPAMAEPGAAFGAYDELAAGGAELASGDGLEPIDGLGAGIDTTLLQDPSSPLVAPAAGELGEYDDTAGFAPGAVFEPPADGGFETGTPLGLGAEASPALDGTVGWPADDGGVDPGFALASGGSFEAAADAASSWATAEPPAPWEMAAPDAAPEPLSLDLPAFELDPDPVTESHPLAAASPAAAASGEDDLALPEIVEEIPTVEGEEILEEIPADEAALLPPSLDFPAA